MSGSQGAGRQALLRPRSAVEMRVRCRQSQRRVSCAATGGLCRDRGGNRIDGTPVRSSRELCDPRGVGGGLALAFRRTRRCCGQVDQALAIISAELPRRLTMAPTTLVAAASASDPRSPEKYQIPADIKMKGWRWCRVWRAKARPSTFLLRI